MTQQVRSQQGCRSKTAKQVIKKESEKKYILTLPLSQ
jgi:hypothetical protein